MITVIGVVDIQIYKTKQGAKYYNNNNDNWLKTGV